MDVQMPVLDGLEATRRIRAAVGGAVPVIAMTANAFGEDRQACLGAGMNDHLPKPADPDALFAMLLRWLPLPPGAQAEARTAGPPLTDAATARLATVPGMDVADALARCGHRAAMLHRVVQRFIDTYRDGLPALRGGAASQWIGAAHSLRGACAAVGLHALATRLQGFEAAAAMAADADTDPPELAAEAAAIDAELCRVVAAAAAALGLAR
jgi:CheY-like chemotaxis protein